MEKESFVRMWREMEGGGITFNIFDGYNIVRGGGGSRREEGGGRRETMEEGRLTLTQISSVSLDVQCAHSKHRVSLQ